MIQRLLVNIEIDDYFLLQKEKKDFKGFEYLFFFNEFYFNDIIF